MRHPLYAAVLVISMAAPASALELGLPAACSPGVDCFVQQFPDMQAGAGISDPFCGSASYDGHSGTDLRIFSMNDVERGVPVTAMADGTVLRIRDGIADKVMTTPADRAAVEKVECGNGLVVDHGEGYEVQYCHMKQGSLAVKPGDTVKRGGMLGQVGASGMAAFPHVHVTVRKDGKTIDPSTGKALDAGCLENESELKPLFSADVRKGLGQGEAQIIAAGFAGGPVDHNALGLSGPPPAATAASPAFVGWGWFINLRQGDRVRIRLTGPAGGVVAENLSDPMDRSKASWSGFAGKKGAPPKGGYKVLVSVLRGGTEAVETSREIVIN